MSHHIKEDIKIKIVIMQPLFNKSLIFFLLMRNSMIEMNCRENSYPFRPKNFENRSINKKIRSHHINVERKLSTQL